MLTISKLYIAFVLDFFHNNLQHLLGIIPVTFMALFHVVNPIGSGILFLNLTPEADNKLRRKLSVKIAFNSLLIMVVILIAGVFIIKLFGISIPIVQMCGGMMILNMGWKSLNRDDEGNESDSKRYITSAVNNESKYYNQAFYPFTFPFTVGPGTIAVTLTVSAETIQNSPGHELFLYAGALISMVLVSLSVYLCYSSADYMISKLSEQIRKVIMKILSFILLCIGGQIITNGITGFLKQLHSAGII